VLPGALVSFLQKGLQYLELEANLAEARATGRRSHVVTAAYTRVLVQEGTEVDAGFSLLTAHDLLSKDVDELKALVSARRELEAKREKERAKAERDKDRPAAVKPERRAGEVTLGAPPAP
jgi:transducin (beta)-like 1